MFQEIFNEVMKEIKDNKDNVLVVKNDTIENKTDYFVYTDNQTSGDTIKKLCQI